VAEIGKDVITTRQVQNELQALVRGRQIPPEMLQVYAPQYIDQMITDRAIAYQAQRMGFEVPDTELAAYIRQIMPQFFSNGQLIDRMAYESFLADRGMSISDFEATVRKQILATRLQNLVVEGVVVTPQEVEQQFQHANRKVKIEYVSFKPENLRSAVNITPEDLQQYYQANQNNYMERETWNLALLVSSEQRVAASIEVPEAQLRREYDLRREQYRTPERVRARHMLLKTTGKADNEVAATKKRAEELLKQVKSGGNFADLAQKNSEDTVSAEKGGDLGFIVRGQTVPNFEQAAFTLKPNEISDLITTEYGFHIIQVLEKQTARTRPFEEVQGELAADLKRQVVYDRMQRDADQARAALLKSPGNLEQVAQQFNMEVVRAEKIAPGQPIPNLGPVPDLDAAVAGLKSGEITPVFQAGDDKLVVAQVVEAFPSRVRPFNEVEARVRDVVSSQKAEVLATERGNQAATRIKAGEDLQKVARELGGEVKTSSDFTINDAVEGVGAGNLFEEAFGKPVGSVLGPIPAANQSVVARVVSQTPADMSQLDGQRANIIDQIKQRKGQERRELFYDSILAQLIKEGKVKKHNDTIRRLTSAYRS
jgi:peptidyl-prolyl cis-trans isomerase D